MKKNKKFDVVLLGATGYTGKLVAEYLHTKYGTQGDLKWAIAGRNSQKLKRVQKEIGIEEIDFLIVDNNDRGSVDRMTATTKVVCTTVGPYAKYGTLVVASCIENRTHYCDLSGEVQWMRKTIDTYHDEARKNMVKIVHSCGFDSIPSEYTVYFLQNYAFQKANEYCQKIELRLKASKGGLSGGTYESLLNVLKEASEDRSLYKVLLDPYGLNPDGDRHGPDKPGLRKVKYDGRYNEWLTPFLMETINSKIVRRGLSLCSHPYGKGFQYHEAMIAGNGFSGRIKAYIILLGLGLMQAKPGFLQKMFRKLFPNPGEGPDAKERTEGFFYFIARGYLKNGQVFQAKIIGDQDPGYGSTSKMIGEAAVCLAKDNQNKNYGILTPVSAMEDNLFRRLKKNAGLTFSIIE